MDSTKIITVEPGSTVRAGKFQVEFIHVNHSIADSVAFAIHTQHGHHCPHRRLQDRLHPHRWGGHRPGPLRRAGSRRESWPCWRTPPMWSARATPMSERAVGKTFIRQFTRAAKSALSSPPLPAMSTASSRLLDAAARLWAQGGRHRPHPWRIL